MARRHAVRLGIPALIVAGLACVALWRVGPPVIEPTIGTTGPSIASLEHVEVREVLSRRAFWFGSTDTERSLAVLDPDVVRNGVTTLTTGMRVTLVGIVRPAPPANDAMQQWKIGEAAAQALAERGTYLHVTEIKP